MQAPPIWPTAAIVVAMIASGFLLPAWATLALAGLLTIGAIGFLATATDRIGTARTDRPVVSAPAAALRPGVDPTEWRVLVEALPDAAILVDGADVVVHHNSQAQELFASVRRGRAISSGMRHPELIDALDEARSADGPLSVEIHDRVPVEHRVSARLASLPTHADPAQCHVLITFRDLSEEDRLARMRADFIANASHELRTPLAAVRGFVETLQGPAKDDPIARERFLGMMATQALRMSRLIDDLLSLSRIEMKQHLPPRGTVDLNEVVEETVYALQSLADSASILLESKLLDAPAQIRGDRDEILQSVQNLAQNAIKYGHKGGHVSVVVGRRPVNGRAGRLAVSITDDGPGIPAVHLPRLTERFYRVNAASSREKGGTGLGLAIVKHIVNRHRGELIINSQEGQGSTFTIEFDDLGEADKPIAARR